MRVSERLDRLRALFEDARVEAVLVSSATNVRYLTGFTGSAGMLWVDTDRAVLVTDGRYRVQAPEQLAAAEVDVEVDTTANGLANLLGVLSAGVESVGLEAGAVTWSDQRWLDDLLNAQVIATEGLVELLRAVKDEGEVARIAAAAAISDLALSEVVSSFVDGAIEADLAALLDHAVRTQGGADRAFETIIAGGPNSSLPHARPGLRALEFGDLLVCDFGAVVDGYRSDMTRSMRVGGTGSGVEAEMLVAVLEAQSAGLSLVADGVPLADVDAACRSVLNEAGLADAFCHGTGHGVGLDIHEGPGISSSATGNLRSGQVVTVEPGAYIAGLGGVRWEDTVLVTDKGHRPLTRSPKTL